MYASAPPLDFLARTKNPSFPEEPILMSGRMPDLFKGFEIGISGRRAFLCRDILMND
jgi:hypothetical protein